MLLTCSRPHLGSETADYSLTGTIQITISGGVCQQTISLFFQSIFRVLL